MTTRRQFLGLVATGAGSLALPLAFPSGVHAQIGDRANARPLVVLFLRGGLDGLSAVVPYRDAAYADARPTIAIAPPSTRSGDDRSIRLDGRFALHPALAPLHRMYRSRELAIVHAVGLPLPVRSHFEAQYLMDVGAVDRPRDTRGWLTRAIGESNGDAIRAIGIGNGVPTALAGGDAIAVPDLNRIVVGRGRAGSVIRAAIDAMYGDDATPLARAARNGLTAVDRLGRIARDARPDLYPGGDFGRRLAHLAALLRSDIGLEVAYAPVGGWDTHRGQGGERGPLASRLDLLARALIAFRDDLGDLFENVTVLVATEFGRTVEENGSRGTDHGRGTAMFVLGGRVRGGRVLGRWPGLAPEQREEGRDLAVTTDFRDLFAELAVRQLGVDDPASVFPGFSPDARRFPGVLRG